MSLHSRLWSLQHPAEPTFRGKVCNVTLSCFFLLLPFLFQANVAVQQALDATNKALQALSKAASGAVAAVWSRQGSGRVRGRRLFQA